MSTVPTIDELFPIMTFEGNLADMGNQVAKLQRAQTLKQVADEWLCHDINYLSAVPDCTDGCRKCWIESLLQADESEAKDA